MQAATKQLAAQQAAQQTAAAPAPTASATNMDVAPQTSAVSIWFPPSWGKKNATRFDMSMGDPGDEVHVGFKFMNANAAAAQTQGVLHCAAAGVRSPLRQRRGHVGAAGVRPQSKEPHPRVAEDIGIALAVLLALRR